MPLATKPRRVPLLWILLPYALGIAFARFLPLPPASILLPIAAAGVAGAYRFSQNRYLLWLISLGTALLCLGATRFQTLQSPPESAADRPPREATLQIEIDTLFNATDPNTALGICRVIETPKEQPELTGRRIFFFLDTEQLPDYPTEGETFQAKGVVRSLSSYFEGDRFDAYLRNLGIHYAYKQGDLIAKTKGAEGATAFFNSARDHFSKVLSKNAAPESEYTNALKGLMLGEKSELSPAQKQLFLANGTMHLFAISGLHIGVIAVCFHTLLTVLRLGRASRAIATLIAVSLFVLVTGGSASSWRALLMVACFYLASFSKRQDAPINALALSALIYLLILPGQLFQAGFQMSYLTVSSILLLGLPLARTLNELVPLFRHTPKPMQTRYHRWLIASKTRILDGLGVSIAAFLTSALLGIYYFQILPSYGVLINLIALPIASLAIIAGFLSLLLSPFIEWIPLSELFNNAALLLIKLVHLFLKFTSQLPASSIETSAIPATWVSAALLSSLALIGYCYTKLGKENHRIWQATSIVVCTAWIVLLIQ